MGVRKAGLREGGLECGSTRPELCRGGRGRRWYLGCGCRSIPWSRRRGHRAAERPNLREHTHMHATRTIKTRRMSKPAHAHARTTLHNQEITPKPAHARPHV
eukprot:2178224-Rhodomonas_salina.3